ncbi:MAG: hypothetical protein IPM16_19885 [Chloroflexi bacterium]|nr:hypothetical protein [Chloroflexota bacterium]
MRRPIVALALILAVLVVPTLSAQDTPAECPEAADLLPEIIEFATELADEPLTALEMIYEAVQEVRAKCAGLIFTSEEYGLSPALGPISLDIGTYRLSLEIEGQMAINVDLLDLDGDNCGQFIPTLFIVTQTDTQQIVQLERPCDALLEFTTINMNFGGSAGSWMLTIEKLR